jgi:hypothetical protein
VGGLKVGNDLELDFLVVRAPPFDEVGIVVEQFGHDGVHPLHERIKGTRFAGKAGDIVTRRHPDAGRRVPEDVTTYCFVIAGPV